MAADEVVARSRPARPCARGTGGRRCRRRPARAPRRAARARRRSARCPPCRRAPRGSPGRARCRRPRPCGARRCRCRRDARTVRSVSECFANAVSRWSKNGTRRVDVDCARCRRGRARARCSTRSSRGACDAVRGVRPGRRHDAESIEAQRLEERGRLGLGAGRHAQVVRDADVADQDALVEQRLAHVACGSSTPPNSTKFVHDCGTARSRAPASVARDAVALRDDLVDHREHLGACASAADGRRLRERATGGTAGARAAGRRSTAGSAAR